MTTSTVPTTFDQPLLIAKISTPRIPDKYVHRPRLTGRVQQGVHGPLTLLDAPAGFGKTHLLMEWMKEAHLPAAWLTIDSQDNDIQRFFGYFIGALQTLVPGLGKKGLEFIQDTGGSNLEVGLTLLINELFALSEEVALILDDFQVLENPEIIQSVSFLLKYLPANLHLVIASRGEPELDLAWLRAKGRVVDVGAEDLHFTGDEIGQYFRQAIGQPLPPETIQALAEYTDGWIMALQMAAISLQNQADPAMLLANLQGREHSLAGFLSEEVLDRQPEEVRQFLLRTSILETLTGLLCEAVVSPDAQPGSGAAMLNRLDHANLFIVGLNGKHEWFRYHPLFADFLRQVQAEASPDEIPELHKRAARWFEQNGRLADAFRHALASQDLEWAAELIEHNLQAMIKTGEISALNQWMDKLPEEILHRRPYLSLAYAWSLIAARQLHLARYWLDDVRRWLDTSEKHTRAGHDSDRPATGEGFDQDSLRSIRGGLAVCQSAMAMFSGDLDEAAAFYQQAAGDLPEENIYARSFIALEDSLSIILSGDAQKASESLRATIRVARQANNPFVLVIATSTLADMQVLQGQLSRAWETLQRVQYAVQGAEGEPLPLVGLVDMSLGEILLEQDLLGEAREYLERGCQVTRSAWYLGSLNGVMSMARLRQAQGDIAGAQAALEEAARMAFSAEAGEWDDAAVAAMTVRLALLRGDLSGAEVWWKKGGLGDLSGTIAVDDYPYYIYEYLLLTQARFLLVKGQDTRNQADLQRASELLESLLLAAEGYQRVTSQMEILILLAMTQAALGEERSKQTLLRALALGEPEGYRRIFLDEGWRLSKLLRRCRSEQQASGSYFPSLAFIDSLLDDLKRAGSGGSGRQSDPQPTERKARSNTARLEDGFPIFLSARELEVLKMIAAGKSNQEISKEFYLTLNTVKRHAYNIYAKLEVNKRTQAVMKARQIGLIQ